MEKRYDNYLVCIFFGWLAGLVAVALHSFLYSPLETFFAPHVAEFISLVFVAGIGESVIVFLALHKMGRYWGFWVAFGFALMENMMYGIAVAPTEFFRRFIQHGGHMGMWATAVAISEWTGTKRGYNFWGLLAWIFLHAWNNGMAYAIYAQSTHWGVLIYYSLYSIGLGVMALSLWYAFFHLKVLKHTWPDPISLLK